MTQSKLQSIIEVFTGTFIGMIGSWIITFLTFKHMEGDLGLKSTVSVVLCTIWSLGRGYTIRRCFNKIGRTE